VQPRGGARILSIATIALELHVAEGGRLTTGFLVAKIFRVPGIGRLRLFGLMVLHLEAFHLREHHRHKLMSAAVMAQLHETQIATMSAQRHKISNDSSMGDSCSCSEEIFIVSTHRVSFHRYKVSAILTVQLHEQNRQENATMYAQKQHKSSNDSLISSALL
jgi:hypothetical protein